MGPPKPHRLPAPFRLLPVDEINEYRAPSSITENDRTGSSRSHNGCDKD